MAKRVVVALLVVGVAYAVGWMSDAVLIDDPCLSHGAETDRYDYLHRWLPVRTDCRITTRSGESRIVSGSSEVFLAMFALTVVVGFALLSRIAVALRAVSVLAAGAAAVLVIFVL